MTPFGVKMRELRKKKGVNQRQMAAEIGVSPAYLSALEHGHRGIPSWQFLQRVIGYFNIIWDEAEELQTLAATSHTRAPIDTSHLSPEATELANCLAREIKNLTPDDCRTLILEIQNRTK